VGYVDGCVSEGVAAAFAAEAAATADDEDEARALAIIATDAASHAVLSWDIVRWAISDADPATRRALMAMQRRWESGLDVVAGGAAGEMVGGRRAVEVGRGWSASVAIWPARSDPRETAHARLGHVHRAGRRLPGLSRALLRDRLHAPLKRRFFRCARHRTL